MIDHLVVVLNGARARFLRLEPTPARKASGGPNLIEEEDLTNPESEMSGGEVFTTTKTGRNRPSPGFGDSCGHVYDDHRTEHYVEFDRRFAKRVVDEGLQRARNYGVGNLILVANPRMLGHLRLALAGQSLRELEVHELSSDLSKLPVREIHQHVARAGLIPARRLPKMVEAWRAGKVAARA